MSAVHALTGERLGETQQRSCVTCCNGVSVMKVGHASWKDVQQCRSSPLTFVYAVLDFDKLVYNTQVILANNMNTSLENVAACISLALEPGYM